MVAKESRAVLVAKRRALQLELGRRERLPRAVAAYESTLRTDWQRRAALSTARRIAVHAGRRSGKQLPLNTILPTPDGWTTMGLVHVGDWLLDARGKPTRVTAKTAPQVPERAYRLHFTDGTQQVACADHLWLTTTRQERRHGLPATAKTTAQIAATLKRGRRRSDFNHRIPLCAPAEHAPRDLPVDPYLLGQWLGDGTSVTGCITTKDVAVLQPFGPVLVPSSTNGGRCPSYRIPGLTGKLRRLGVLGDKRIPKSYLTSGVEQRKALLAGLMDSDGYCSAGGRLEYCTTSPRLATDFGTLCRGLGLRVVTRESRAKLYGRDCGPRWRFCFMAPWVPFRLDRKAVRYRTDRRIDACVYVSAVEECPTEPMACVSVDSPDHTYLCGRDYRVTHNTYGPGIGRAIRAALANPGATIPVFERTLTCASAQVFWNGIAALNEQFQLEARPHFALYRWTFPNRSVVVLMGCDTQEACDKARGAAYPEAIVDEAGTVRPHVLDYLLREVLGAALMDYGGTLTLLGTPIPRPDGHPFYAACTDPALAAEWERHHGTFLDNDALPLNCADLTPEERRARRQEEFEAELRRLRLDVTAPYIQREWLGNWVRDEDGLVYTLQPSNHAGVAAPDFTRGDWKYGLGIDLGYNDPTAFVILAWRRGDPRVWVVESFQEANLIPTAVVARVERLRARYRFAFIVADTGGYGKGPVEELRALRIPVEAAAKRGKEAHFWVANGDLRTNAVQIVEATNQELIADLYGLRKDADGKEDERDANHLPDAFLYGLMRVRGRLAPELEPPATEAERRAADEAAMEEAAERAACRMSERNPPDTLEEAVDQL